jgi:hypothetical protein
MKYSRQHTVNVSQRSKKTMNGLLGKFSLENFDEFFDNYKLNNTLAHEALTAINHFFPVFNEFFDLFVDLTEEMIAGNNEINWYAYANLESSGDYIRAKSLYYNEPSFSDVSINMSVEEVEDYRSDDGTCFGKVQQYHIFNN